MNDHAQCVGLVGGLGVAAGVHYYQALSDAQKAVQRPLRFVMAHAEVSKVLELVQQGDIEGVAVYLSEFLGQLYRAGATFAALPAILPHICFAELVPRSPLPLISLLDVVRHEVESRELSRVAVFGTRFAMESNLFGSLGNVDVIKPRLGELELIHKAYSSLVFDGKGSPEVRSSLIALGDTLVKREHVQVVILAGTDFSVIFNEQNTPFPAIDCAEVHIRAILRAMR